MCVLSISVCLFLLELDFQCRITAGYQGFCPNPPWRGKERRKLDKSRRGDKENK